MSLVALVLRRWPPLTPIQQRLRVQRQYGTNPPNQLRRRLLKREATTETTNALNQPLEILPNLETSTETASVPKRRPGRPSKSPEEKARVQEERKRAQAEERKRIREERERVRSEEKERVREEGKRARAEEKNRIREERVREQQSVRKEKKSAREKERARKEEQRALKEAKRTYEKKERGRVEQKLTSVRRKDGLTKRLLQGRMTYEAEYPLSKQLLSSYEPLYTKVGTGKHYHSRTQVVSPGLCGKLYHLT
jgi:hypothetical protein